MIKFLEKPAIMLKNGRFFMQEMDYKQIKLNFQENYFKNIKPKLHIFEKVRLKNKKDVIKYSILTVLICFATAVALFVWGDFVCCLLYNITDLHPQFFKHTVYRELAVCQKIHNYK